MKSVSKLIHISFVSALLGMSASSQSTASEPVPIPSTKPQLASRTPPILIDGRPQTLTFDLGSKESRKELAGVGSYTRTCNGTSAAGISFSYDCPSTYSITRDVHIADIHNRVTVIIPEVASSFGSLNEVLSISQNGSAMHVSTSRTSKKVLIYTQADTTTTSTDRDAKLTALATTIYVQLADLSAITRPVTEGITDFAVNGSYLSYKIGRITDPSLLRVKIRIEDTGISAGRIISAFMGEVTWADEFAFTGNDLVVQDEGDRFSRVSIDLNGLGVLDRMRGLKTRVGITTALELAVAGLANVDDLPPLSIYKEWTVRVEKK